MKRLQFSMFLILALMGCVNAPRKSLLIGAGPNEKPTGTFSLPLKNPRVLSSFGKRGHGFHTGIDLQENRKSGDPILASRAGKVSNVGRLSGYGLYVTLKHDDGFYTRYAHMRETLVKQGQTVERGAIIGRVGSTGRATTPHVHFEILTPTYRYIDPAPFIFENK